MRLSALAALHRDREQCSLQHFLQMMQSGSPEKALVRGKVRGGPEVGVVLIGDGDDVE
jgi:hypothetical protein